MDNLSSGHNSAMSYQSDGPTYRAVSPGEVSVRTISPNVVRNVWERDDYAGRITANRNDYGRGWRDGMNIRRPVQQ